MYRYLPALFSFLVSGAVAGAVITFLVCGTLDGLSRLPSMQSRRRDS
jgi:hypothetical protein